jgi:hypothetical protein
MQPTNRKINCPGCGKEIELEEKQDQPNRLIAFCACNTGNLRPVYETDASPAVVDVDQLQADTKGIFNSKKKEK